MMDLEFTLVTIPMVLLVTKGLGLLRCIIMNQELIGQLMKTVTGHLLRMSMVMVFGIRMNR